MLPSGFKSSYMKKEYNSPAKNTMSRNSYSLNHKPLINFNQSPRLLSDIRHRDDSLFEIGQKMRLMKSKIGNLSIQSRNGMNQNNLYPTELIFLLSNQEGNVGHIKKLIQQEKKRVNRDFQNFTKQVLYLIQDLKLSVHSQLDNVFRDFISLYGSLKQQVVELRQNRKRILQQYPNQQYDAKSNYRSQGFKNNTNTNNSVSNLNFLQQISKDQDYFKNMKIYEEITSAYFQAIGPIMSNTQDILSIGSQIQYYKDEKCNQILNNIRNNFFNNTKVVFQNELNNIVVQTNQIIQQNNNILKDLNMQQPKYDRNEYSTNYGNQRNKISSIHGNFQQHHVNNGDVNYHQNKKRRAQTEVNPYGFQIPSFKNAYNQNQNEGSKKKGMRPSSSTQHIKYRSRPESQWSNKKKQVQAERQRYTITTNLVQPNQVQQKPYFKTTRDEQNIIVQWAQKPKLVKENLTINAVHAQDILLCLVFVANNKFIAVGSKDKNVYIYNAATGRIVQTLSGHTSSVCSLANFNTFFASGGDNGCSSLILWEVNQWKMKRKVSLHTSALTCITDLLDGSHLATGGYDKKIQIYNYKKSEKKQQVASCKAGVTALIVCEYSRKLVSAGLDSTVSIWNIFTRNGELDTVTLDRIITNCGLASTLRPLILSPDFILVGNKDGKVMIVNVNTGQIIKSLTVGRGTVIELNTIERQNKPQFPIILSCCSGEREMIMTKSDSGVCESTKARISIIFGCGIGPKVVVQQSGIFAIINQSSVEKQITFYKMQTS